MVALPRPPFLLIVAGGSVPAIGLDVRAQVGLIVVWGGMGMGSAASEIVRSGTTMPVHGAGVSSLWWVAGLLVLHQVALPGPAAAALAAAACWGLSTVLVRWIGRTDPTLVQVVSANGIFVLGSLVPLAWLWRTPGASDLAVMLGLGAVGGLGQFLLLEGFRHAPASALAPVEYTGLVWAGVYGYAIWADVPGPGTFAGAALIVAGSLGLVWSESRARRMA